MDNASWKPELLKQSNARGYQWKSLFLPEGTEIRREGTTVFGLFDGG